MSHQQNFTSTLTNRIEPFSRIFLIIFLSASKSIRRLQLQAVQGYKIAFMPPATRMFMSGKFVCFSSCKKLNRGILCAQPFPSSTLFPSSCPVKRGGMKVRAFRHSTLNNTGKLLYLSLTNTSACPNRRVHCWCWVRNSWNIFSSMKRLKIWFIANSVKIRSAA